MHEPSREIIVPASDVLPPEAIEELLAAKEILTRHGLADRLTELIGAPILATMRMLPESAERMIHSAIDKSLRLALDAAISTLGGKEKSGRPRLFSHKLLAGVSGAAGGAFGITAVAAELPVSTMLILRSVADIARSEGEDLANLESRLACLEVFAIGHAGESEIDDETQLGYFAVRAAMATQITEATKYALRGGAVDTTAPPLLRLLTEISKRFGIVVSEKVAAQAVPVIGAVGGALINTYFIDHYQDLARAHFTIRRLERTHSPQLVRDTYQHLNIDV